MAGNDQNEIMTFETPLAGRLLGWLLLGAFATVALSMLLPNKDYYRWQQGDGTILFRARYIYERIHFDKRPINVAMIGSSRIEASVRADELGTGLSKSMGQPIAVENFGLPQEGRDLSWTIAEQLLNTRSDVKLVVLVVGPESNISHPGFRFLSDDASIIDAPILVNYNYVKNMLTLPYRHIAYFVQGLWPRAFQLSATFDPEVYRTLSFDPTKPFHMPYGTLVNRDAKLKPEQAAAPVHLVMPGSYYDWKIRNLPLDYRYPIDRHYTRQIARLARNKGVKIAFLSVPTYHGAQEIYDDRRFFEQYGPIISASFVADNPDNYMDPGHLNRIGTGKVTPWLIDKLTPILREAEEKK